MPDNNQLRVIVYKESDQWFAQCLEHDIAAHAADLKELEARLCAAIGAELQYSAERGEAPFTGIRPAPQHFHDLWTGRAGEYQPTKPTVLQDPCTPVKLQMALAA